MQCNIINYVDNCTLNEISVIVYSLVLTDNKIQLHKSEWHVIFNSSKHSTTMCMTSFMIQNLCVMPMKTHL